VVEDQCRRTPLVAAHELRVPAQGGETRGLLKRVHLGQHRPAHGQVEAEKSPEGREADEYQCDDDEEHRGQERRQGRQGLSVGAERGNRASLVDLHHRQGRRALDDRESEHHHQQAQPDDEKVDDRIPPSCGCHEPAQAPGLEREVLEAGDQRAER
jgi:hypothetical protein